MHCFQFLYYFHSKHIFLFFTQQEQIKTLQYIFLPCMACAEKYIYFNLSANLPPVVVFIFTASQVLICKLLLPTQAEFE